MQRPHSPGAGRGCAQLWQWLASSQGRSARQPLQMLDSVAGMPQNRHGVVSRLRHQVPQLLSAEAAEFDK